MGLVDYSSSSESEEQSRPSITTSSKRKHAEIGSLNKKSLPPLPVAFRDLYASTARVSTDDDPAFHGGRQRTVPHVEGNWPTHVYVEWLPSPKEVRSLNDLIDAVRETLPASSARLQSSLKNDLGVSLLLHISLSAPLILRTERKEAFLDAVTANIKRSVVHLKQVRNAGADIAVSLLRFSGVDWACNAEGTRWFLVLRIAKPDGDELNELLAACNKVAASEGMSTLYAPPGGTPKQRGDERGGPHSQTASRRRATSTPSDGTSHPLDLTDRFHFSIGWMLGNPGNGPPERTIVNIPPKVLEAVLDINVKVDAVKVKIGNVVTSIPLNEERGAARGMLG